MSRFAPAFFLSTVLAFGGGGAALGQTVADFDAALAKAPIIDAPPPVALSYCRVVMNYTFTSIPSGERSGIVVPLWAFSQGTDPEIARKRAICEEVRQQAVIQFDAGTGEEIVTPPKMTDTNANPPYNPEVYGPGAGLREPMPGERRSRRPAGIIPQQ